MKVNFGGLDIAQRVDNTSLQTIQLNDGTLEQIGEKTWPHIDFGLITRDVEKINRLEKYNRIHYDKTGQGELARKVFSPEIPLYGVQLSLPRKLAIITLMRAFFNQKKLIIHDRELYRELLEQEEHITDAGNRLYRHPEGFHDDRFWAFGLAVDAAATYMKMIPKYTAAVAKKPKSVDDEIEEYVRYV